MYIPKKPLNEPATHSSGTDPTGIREVEVITSRPKAIAPLDGLLAGLRLALGTGDAASDREVLARVEDWKAVATLAERHRVSLLLLQGIESNPELLADTGIEATLKARRRRNIRNGMRQLAALTQASRCLDAAGIPLLILKGLPLSQQLHGYPMAREAIDIDLLVAPETFHVAERTLASVGWQRYQPAFEETPTRTDWWRWLAKDHWLMGPNGVKVELHWRTEETPCFLNLPFDRLYANSTAVQLGAAAFRVPGVEDRLLYLAVHAAVHHWKRLKWLCDLAASLQAMEAAELDRAVARFREAKLDSILSSTLLLCRDALHVDSGDEAVRKLIGRRARAATGISRMAWGRTGIKATVLEFCAFNTVRPILAPSARFALRQMAVLYFVAPNDWKRINLPDRFFFLYFLLRPLSWLVRQVGDASKAPNRPRLHPEARNDT